LACIICFVAPGAYFLFSLISQKSFNFFGLSKLRKALGELPRTRNPPKLRKLSSTEDEEKTKRLTNNSKLPQAYGIWFLQVSVLEDRISMTDSSCLHGILACDDRCTLELLDPSLLPGLGLFENGVRM
jgi:hypothetical protein